MANDGIQEVILSNGQNASMQVVQQIYKDVTGKSEKLSKTYSINHQTVFADFEGLHRRLEHILEQYQIVEGGCTVIFSHIDDSSERYSSFDRARGFEVGSMIPMESIDIEYTFLIILPIAKKPEKYKIRINLRSRASMLEKMREMDGFEAQFASLFAAKTAMVSVDYVDYAVARNIFREIDQWMHGLSQVKINPLIGFLKSNSHHFQWLFKYLTAISILSFFLSREILFSANDLNGYIRFGLVSFGTIFIASGLASQLGRWCESLADGYQVLSYLKFNRGDERVVNDYKKSMKFRWVKACVSGLFAIVINIIASWLAIKFGIH